MQCSDSYVSNTTRFEQKEHVLKLNPANSGSNRCLKFANAAKHIRIDWNTASIESNITSTNDIFELKNN